MDPQRSRSPLKSRPLRLPGQSVQDALDALVFDQLVPYFLLVIFLSLTAGLEWLGALRQTPRQPWLWTAMAVLAAIVCAWQFARIQRRAAQLRLGRDGERAIGQFLEELREDGARVFHDVLGEGFNLDHVVLSPKGFLVIETKTYMKPRRGDATVTLTDHSIRVGPFRPDRDPIVQAQAGARWLSELLEQSTGKRFPVRSAIVFPGWWVEPMSQAWKQSDLPWVLEPKALPAFMGALPMSFEDADVKLASFHLSRYIRSRISAPA
jgi:hypothetical protein